MTQRRHTALRSSPPDRARAHAAQGGASLQVELLEAARRIAEVAAGRSFSLDRDVRSAMPEESRAALLDLCLGTLRRYARGRCIVDALSRRGRASPIVDALLWCALYALDSGRYADYTVVSQAVSACALAGEPAAGGYVNAVLRSYLRRRKTLEARILDLPEARYQHPGWWIDTLRQAYPEDWQPILEAGNSHPPMCLRANPRRVSPPDYAARLAREGFPLRDLGHGTLLLERPVPVDRLPGFANGEVSVQDAGAQRAARLLDLRDGQRVLDACAAPGGKSAHILETARVALTAIDHDAQRSERVSTNLARLGLSARVQTADCMTLDSWWDGAPFHRVLADVPCSASGVARRHPDIKWLRRESDIAAFAQRQGAMLDALWRVLAAGGRLLYVTCSVFPAENEAVVAAFCARTPGARRGVLADGGPAQLLPGPLHDGFFFAVLDKHS